MNVRSLDILLVETYKAFDLPVDQFLAEDALTEQFAKQIRRRARDDSLETIFVMRRLMNLRKKGLLPRLRRAYNGRTQSTQAIQT